MAPRLSDFIFSQKAAIIERWLREIELRPSDVLLPRSVLTDHLPDILDQVGLVLREGHAQPSDEQRASVRLHAVGRLDYGMDLQTLLREHATLRRVMFAHWNETVAEALPYADMVRFNELLDEVMAQSAADFMKARTRTFEALDAISSQALSSERLDVLLPRLLEVAARSIHDVDTVMVLLRQGDRLVLAGSVGVKEDPDFSLRVGQGFAGTIAVTRQPLELQEAGVSPLVLSPALRSMKLRALYGLPLIERDEVLGVVHVGSLTANEFSEADKILFRTLASRMAALIYQSRAQEERRELISQERAARATAEQAVAVRDEVLSIVSHDLRSPLSTIVFAASTMRTKPPKDAAAAATLADRILRSADRMTRLVGDLVDLSAVRSGRLSIVKRPESVIDILREAIDAHLPAAAEKQIHLSADPEQNLPQVDVDRSRVLQVISNLMSNALKVVPSGGKIELKARGVESRVVFSVIDSGPGINQEDLARIFEKYFRGKDPQYKGTGLGLTIARGIVDAHGGHIWAESEPGKGTAFHFTLPLAGG